ncbi:ORF9 [Alcelaphine gammaherpesvirus 1]|nr:ORF9 [Alcelaphine gammaherpesvirus 1]QDY92312.1 DNA polymerase catalytic subunit [Alcelaphine gammaherpesvirus 1]
MLSFWNPYLRGFKAPTPATKSKPKASTIYHRLIPKCFKKDERENGGIFAIETAIPPTAFYLDSELLVLPENKSSLWANETLGNCHSIQELMFHVYDIVEVVYAADRCDSIPPHLQADIVPSGIVLKLYGRTETNQSVCVNVFGQKVYFYVYNDSYSNLQRDVQHILQETGHRSTGLHLCSTQKKFLSGYSTSSHEVYQITLGSSSAMRSLASGLEQIGYRVFEANVDASTRFIVDNKFSTFGWYTCTSPLARPRVHQDAHTHLEYDCSVGDIQYHAERLDWPQYNILSFDIECLGESGFPSADKDEDMIIQISCVIWTVGGDGKQECILLSVGTCDLIENVKVYEFPSEMDLLYGFFTLLRDYGIEMITGYNICNFDFPYILNRAQNVYNIKPEDFSKTKTNSLFYVYTPQEGNFMRSHSKVKMSGVVVIDMYQVCRDKLNLSNYKLNTVAKECLGEKKNDVSYKDIPILFKGSSKDRAKLGMYCVQDAVLVIDLLKHFMTHIEITEIAKIANIPTRRVLSDGQQIRVFTCLLAAAQERDYILPMPVTGSQEGYQGATVINPISGFYNTPVLVVDFASLYPSIIQAHNLCYSTLIKQQDLPKFTNLTANDYETFMISGGPVHFVKKHKTESLLASLLKTWLAKRKSIKKELEQCQDAKMKTILDKQQLAIKVTCNSVYGFTGVASGMLPCLMIAETVTLQGRTMLEKTKQFVENVTVEYLQKICNFEVQCLPQHPNPKFRVVYGDTDSLFIKCEGFAMDTVIRFGDALASHTSSVLFASPIKLESEKVFKCLMLLTKKRYVGILSNNKILMKGVDLVRKTACVYVQEVTRAVLELLLRDEEVKVAAQTLSYSPVANCFKTEPLLGFLKIIDILNQSYSDLKSNKVPVANLTYSTELSKPFTEYKTTNLPHLAVYKKLAMRNEELPQIHDRISYVFVKSNGHLVSDMAEDPTYAEQNKIPIASDWYFDKIIHGVANILQCVFNNNTSATVEVLYNFVRNP